MKDHIVKNRKRILRLAAVAVMLGGPAQLRAEEGEAPPYGGSGALWILSPLVGANRDKLKQPKSHRSEMDRNRAGARKNKTAPEYGIFALAAHPRFAVNNFLFFTEAAGDTDVMGNFFHLNLYGNPESSVTWNLGGGHLYHKIKPHRGEIKVSVPMIKLGLVGRLDSIGVTLNPYVGHAWERVEAMGVDVDNDSYIYGMTVDWRWRMINLNFKYYHQHSHDGQENSNNFHARATMGVTRNWGAAMRIDRMENTTSDDTSFLIGPVLVF